MSVYITKEGKKKHEEELLGLQKELERVAAEKKYAYDNCGDTWHDNPTFNALEREEQRLALKIKEKRSFLSDAEIVEIADRSVTRVEIGSIVKITKFSHKTKKHTEAIWEIVGIGESDPPNKKVAYNTPMGSSLMEMKVGEEKVAAEPAGNATYKVIKFFNNWEEARHNEDTVD